MEDQGKLQSSPERYWQACQRLSGGIQRQLVAKQLAELAIPTTDNDCISRLRKRHRCLV